jgi:hypothetical protein
MSTVKANTVTASTTNGNVSIVGNGTGKVTLGDGNLIFPDADGSAGQYLQTNGSGTLSFGDVTAPAIAQVVSSQKTDTFTTTSTSYVDVPSLSVSITPSSASNKVFVLATIALGADYYQAYARLMRDSTAIAIGDAAGNRDATSLGWSGTLINANDDYLIMTQPIIVLDSPATTSATTYKLQCRAYDASFGISVNRTWLDSDTVNYVRVPSSITVMEVVV